MALRTFQLKPGHDLERDDFLIEISGKGVINTAQPKDDSITIFHYAPTVTHAVHFRYHQNAYTAFVVCNGRFKFWNHDQAYNLCVGDFVFVPPETIYGYKPLEPQSEFIILTTVRNSAGLFRALQRDHGGELLPSSSTQGGDTSYDIHLQQNYLAPDIIKGLDMETSPPTILQPYFLHVTNSTSWMLGGVMSRPCVTPTQSEGRFSISALETWVPRAKPFVGRWLCFTRVIHCFYIIKGVFKIKLKDEVEWTLVRDGQAIVVPERQEFTGDVGSDFLRMIVFSNGAGIDNVIYKAGSKCEGSILPEAAGRWDGWDEFRFLSACVEVGALLK